MIIVGTVLEASTLITKASCRVRIQSIDAETFIEQAAEYFRLGESELTRKRGRHRQERALAMELLHRYSGLKQRMIAERFGGLDEGLVSHDRRAIRKKSRLNRRFESGFRISPG